MIKPSLVKGTRDFGPIEKARRNEIVRCIQSTFVRYGFMEIETPAMEKMETLTGKYGEEGDQLLFKILNSGHYLQKANDEVLANKDSAKLTAQIAEKGLHYDLTVPFARYTVMHQNDIAFPFRRFQIQPVWRADRPQKGRYREFYQCDADIIGSDSLINDFECVQMYHEVFAELKIPVVIKLNNRKVLQGIAEMANCVDQFTDMTICIDKLDKIGKGGVIDELKKRSFAEDSIEQIERLLFDASLEELASELQNDTGKKGIAELQYILDRCKEVGITSVEVDLTLARGLDYYTGMIAEVKAPASDIGSLGGGGRYDNLTEMFGLSGISGVGISFGLDRIYDVLNEMGLFGSDTYSSTTVLFLNFDENSEIYAFKALQAVRQKGVASEMYPSAAKLKKQMKYANQKNIPWVFIAGDREIEKGVFTVKNMTTGDQSELSLEDALALIEQS